MEKIEYQKLKEIFSRENILSFTLESLEDVLELSANIAIIFYISDGPLEKIVPSDFEVLLPEGISLKQEADFWIDINKDAARTISALPYACLVKENGIKDLFGIVANPSYESVQDCIERMSKYSIYDEISKDFIKNITEKYPYRSKSIDDLLEMMNQTEDEKVINALKEELKFRKWLSVTYSRARKDFIDKRTWLEFNVSQLETAHVVSGLVFSIIEGSLEDTSFPLLRVNIEMDETIDNRYEHIMMWSACIIGIEALLKEKGHEVEDELKLTKLVEVEYDTNDLSLEDLNVMLDHALQTKQFAAAKEIQAAIDKKKKKLMG
ncbi:MAG: hypothetical protein LBL47_03845 [Lactobacillus sp.]|jgi:hypothetical protein|nr:hypothetical protein [Lactobacillus sp.]